MTAESLLLTNDRRTEDAPVAESPLLCDSTVRGVGRARPSASPEAVAAELIRDARAALGCSPDDSGLRSATIRFDRGGPELSADYSLEFRRFRPSGA